MILLLKTSIPDQEDRPPMHERMILIFKEKVREADNPKDRARAKRDLAELQGGSKKSDKKGARD